MAQKVLIHLGTNCKWAELRLLNGIRGLRLNKGIELPGVTFKVSPFLLQILGNERENDVWAWFEAEFTGAGLPKVKVQCGSWNQTTAQFRWPTDKASFYYCTAGPGGVANPRPSTECEIYLPAADNLDEAVDSAPEWGRAITPEPLSEPD